MYAEAGGAVTCFKGKVLRSFQRIICSLHTQEPEMKISTLLEGSQEGSLWKDRASAVLNCDTLAQLQSANKRIKI